MKLRIDTHTHSIASGHAYSTVDENLRWAAEKGLEMVAKKEIKSDSEVKKWNICDIIHLTLKEFY